jgi:hypothetical protein
MPMPRTAQEVIDQAIKENRWNGRLLFTFATIFVLCGTSAIFFGMYKEQPLVALAGGIASALFLPAMKQAREVRRENMAIRLMESAIDRSGSAEEALQTLRGFFETTFAVPSVSARRPKAR